MKPIIKIAKTELQKLFYSPVAWMILVIFTFQVSVLFVDMMSNLVHAQRMKSSLSSLTWTIFSNSPYPLGIFHSLTTYLYLYIPLLTMNSMSRELSSGSIKLLYSSPVTSRQIVLGKYLALMIFALALVAIMGVFGLYAIVTVDHVDAAIIGTALLGLYLMICAYAAIGLYMSSLTSYAVVAAMGTLGILAFLGYVKSFAQEIAFVRDITYWLAISGRVSTFIVGLITSEDVLYFIVVIGLFLSFTVIRLHSGRLKMSPWITFSQYAGVFVIAMMIGYFSTLPKLKRYVDTTRTQINTLTKSSQEVVSKLPEGLTIITYANVLAPHYWVAIPASYKFDVSRFEKYIRFKPDIQLKYKYYWHKADNPSLEKQFPNLTDEQRLDTLKMINQWKFDIEPYSKEFAEGEDLSIEGFRFLRVMKTSTGKTAILRSFNDLSVLPSEAEITAAMKRLVEDLPTVAFVTGQGERESNGEPDRGYKMFTQEKTFRYSLLNNGFDFNDVSLDTPIPENINVMVIAEMKKTLNDSQKTNLRTYIERGGNLLIAGEPGRQEYMNHVTEPLGVHFMSGQLVNSSEKFQNNLVISQLSPGALNFSHHFKTLKERDMVLPLLSTTGLKQTGDTGFKISELFHSDTSGWNELQTTDFVDDSATRSPAIEPMRSYPVIMALSRNINNREQKIIITGDADWLSNGELAMNRNGIRAANFNLIQAAFFWLSDGEVPIDMRRDPPKDNSLRLDKASWDISAVFLKWIFPILLLGGSCLILIRRRRR